MTNEYINSIILICNNSKYTKWYISICMNGITRLKSSNKTSARKEAKILFGYVEGHHILPKCLSSLMQIKDFNNYTFLTAREHFLCHWLLTKMFDSNIKYKMKNAFSKFLQINDFQNRNISSFKYELLKLSASESLTFKNKNMSNETKLKISNTVKELHKNGTYLNANYNCKRASETMKQAHLNGRYKNSYTLERNEKIKNSLLGKTGKESRGYRGTYITPFGNFDSSHIAATFIKVSVPTILNLCVLNNDKIIKSLKKTKKYWKDAEIGKTPGEQGWAFIPK